MPLGMKINHVMIYIINNEEFYLLYTPFSLKTLKKGTMWESITLYMVREMSPIILLASSVKDKCMKRENKIRLVLTSKIEAEKIAKF